MANKVKFNICNVHYALFDKSEEGVIKYKTPVPMPGAVSISLDPNGEPESFYADGIEYYTISNNMGYDGFSSGHHQTQITVQSLQFQNLRTQLILY